MGKWTRKPVWVTEDHLKRYGELARAGVTNAEAREIVKEEFNLPDLHTPQAIYLRFKGTGIKFNRGSRRGKVTVDIKRKGNGNGQPTWEQVKDFIIGAIETASRVSELEAELHKYRVGYDNAMTQLKEMAKTKDEEKRYKLALQQGEVNPPSGKRKSGSSFTYHI